MGVRGNNGAVGGSEVAVGRSTVGGSVSDGRYVTVLMIFVLPGGVLEQHSF